MHRAFLFVLLSGLAALPLQAADLKSSQGVLAVTTVTDDLQTPWAFAFLPGGGVLITERAGRLWHLRADGSRAAVDGLGEIAVTGQGGLLDVMVPRDFSETRDLFFTYAKPQADGAGTAVAKARLTEDGTALRDWRVIFEMTPGSTGGRHFGSRLVEAPDGHLLVTVGERGDRPSAQDLGRENGSVLRIARDGSVPQDNPFVDRANAQPEIWSWGHRNPQGAALDAQGRLWVAEHGAKGGDEINLIRRGANYGWPVISYGRHYSGAKIGEGTSKPGMEQPEFYWDPSIAPSGMMIYSGALWPDWKGDMFVGSLKFGHIARLSGRPPELAERLESPATARVRDVREAPDGSIWFLSEGRGALYRIAP